MTPRKYAKALHLVLEGQDSGSIQKILGSFFKVLKRRGALKLLPLILKEFIDQKEFQSGTKKAVFVSAQKQDPSLRKIIRNYLADLFGAKEMIVQEKIDPEILGGFKIEAGDFLIDSSLKGALFQLKEKLKQ